MKTSISTTPKLYFGKSVPFLDLLGLVPTSMTCGHVEAFLPARPELANTTGHIHGGMLMSVLDFAMSAAARSHDPENLAAATIDMHTSFLMGAKGDLTLTADCVRQGRSIAFCEAHAKSADGQLVAKASGTFSIKAKSATPAGNSA